MGTTTGTRVIEHVTMVLSDRHRELALLIALLSCTFAMVALLGYAPEDPTLLRPGEGPVTNPCGPLGALLADALFLMLGHGAWATFGVMVACVLALARRPMPRASRMISGGMLYFVSLGIVHLAFRPGLAFPPGGLVGRWEAELLEAVLGTVGAWLALTGAALVALTLLGHIQWGRVISRGVDAGERWLPRLGEFVRRWIGHARDSGWRVLGLMASRLWAGVRRFGRGTTRAARRMGRSLARREGDYEPDADFDGSEVHRLDVAPGELTPSDAGEDKTAVGLPVAIAEVEWEPTGQVDEGSSAVLQMFPELEPRASASDGGNPVGPGTWIDRDAPTTPSVEAAAAPEPVWRQEGMPSIPPPALLSSVDEEAMDPVPAPRKGDTATPAPPRASKAPSGKASSAKTPAAQLPEEGGAGLAVHRSRYLDLEVKDDGGAVNRPVDFKLPELKLLDIVPKQQASFDTEELRRLARTVEETLESFKVTGNVTDVRVGPVVTTFEFLPAAGVSVRKVANLQDDLAMALCALSVRIVAPIPGKGVVGIEIPSPTRLDIFLREILASPEFRDQSMALPCALGKDVEGRPVIEDLAKMPHLLVGGTTGSGKSVGVNAMLMSMLFTRSPDELRLLLVDPKILEFKMYEDIPHLLHPVVTEPDKAAAALAWACREMDDRYEVLARWDTRNIASYNQKIERELKSWTREKAVRYCPDSDPNFVPEKLPYIVIVIDELADLMMVAKKDVETSIARIAQKARACGIHLIVATQRPSVDVVTGLIKSNLPTRISFKLRSVIDSRTVLDAGGAESLLGRGDMLVLPNAGELVRCHGAFVSDDEVSRVVQFLREQGQPVYVEGVTAGASMDAVDEQDLDEMYGDAVEIVVRAGKASTSMVQRHLKIGYNRAARIIEQMESRGVVGPADGARPREVLVGDHLV